MQHVGHLVRVVLVHLAAEGFDKYFFRHGIQEAPNLEGELKNSCAQAC
jgi:hypothetical protein